MIVAIDQRVSYGAILFNLLSKLPRPQDRCAVGRQDAALHAGRQGQHPRSLFDQNTVT